MTRVTCRSRKWLGLSGILLSLATQAKAETGWACIREGEQELEKYTLQGDVLVGDNSDFIRSAIPGIDPHSTDSKYFIVEHDSRDILAVLTSTIAARSGSYTGQTDRPWMVSVFINKQTGDARFISADFERDGRQSIKKGRCTHFG